MGKTRIYNSKLDGLNFNLDEDFVKLLEQYDQGSAKKEGSVVKGKITNITSDTVTVDIGIKDEGRIPMREFVQNGKLPELSVGESVEVFIESLERRGSVILSREQAIRETSWENLEKAMNSKTPIQGIVFGRVKGGLTVDLNGVIAFLPGSQIDVKPVKDISDMLGVEQPFLVLKIDRQQGNVVVSRRAIIEESRSEARDEVLAGIKTGQILEGTVKNITDYGAFIDLGNFDGLLHVTDISWNKINHPSEVLSANQKVKVQVIKFDEASRRVSLGMKQLENNPWSGLDAKYPIGTKMTGKVSNVADYGIFVEIEPGIEGLVHVSELSWVRSNVSPRKLFTEGQEVDFIILDIDVDKHRISLGMKQRQENIWNKLLIKYPVGTKLEATVEKVVDFGMFVNFGEEVNALVHANDISWTEDPAISLKKYKKDDVIHAVVLAVDAEKERINLGIKQSEQDPLEGVFSNLKKYAIVGCIVKSIEKEGILVSIEDSTITSFIKKIDLSNDKMEQRSERFAVGDRISAKIIYLEKSNRQVGLSIKAMEHSEQKQKMSEYGSTSSGASLGDILGNAISEVGTSKKTRSKK